MYVCVTSYVVMPLGCVIFVLTLSKFGLRQRGVKSISIAKKFNDGLGATIARWKGNQEFG